jgi:hypothetical protein
MYDILEASMLFDREKWVLFLKGKRRRDIRRRKAIKQRKYDRENYGKETRRKVKES